MEWFKYIDIPCYLVVAIFIDLKSARDTAYFAGVAIQVVGFALWMTARYQLGASFSVAAQAKRLVTTGLYAKFRHPIYLFAQAAFFGVFLAGHVWRIGLLFIVLSSFGQMRRARREEAVLEHAFGEEYRAWRARTWI
jgi:protein-S-isoprenylcysteine O-methyltransferase Ste14